MPLALSVPVAIAALQGGGVGPRAQWVGSALVGLGVLLRLLAMRRIGRGARVHRAGVRERLSATGPYRWSRNPLYLAAGLILCGLGVLAGAGWSAAWLVPATLAAYTPVVWGEESALRAQLGGVYRRYVAVTPRWLGWPRSRPPAPTESVALVRWGEVFRREKRLLPGCLAAGIAVVAIRSEAVPLAREFRGAAQLLDCDAILLALALASAVLAGNGIHVERHRRRRAAEREVASGTGVGAFASERTSSAAN